MDTEDKQEQAIETVKHFTAKNNSEPDNESQDQTINQNNQDLQDIATSQVSTVTLEPPAPVSQPVRMIPPTMPINQKGLPYDYTSCRPSVTMPHVFDVKHGAPYMYGGQYNPWMPQMAYPQTDAQGAAERPSVVYVPVPLPVQGCLPYMPNFMYDQQAWQMTGDGEIKTDANNLQSDANSNNAFKKQENAKALHSSMDKGQTFQQPSLSTEHEQQKSQIMSRVEGIQIKTDANNLQSVAKSTNAFENKDNDEALNCSMDKDKTFRPPLLNRQDSTVSMDRFGYSKPGAIHDEIDQSTMLSSMLERAGTRNQTRPLPSTPNEGQPTENINNSFPETTKLKTLDISKEPDQGFKLPVKEHCKIKIENIPQAVSSATIEMFFANPIQSGGGDISSVEMKSKTGEAIIDFKEEQTVESVLEKQKHVGGFDFYRTKIVVSKYTTIVLDPLKLFVSNIASSDMLLNFIEARCKVRPCAAINGDTPGTMMLVFNTKPDFAKLKLECKKKSLEESYLNIYEVEVTRSIKVQGWPKESSPEELAHYFERKESGGGEVEDTVYQSLSGCHIVTFRHAQDAKRVNEQGTHKVDNTHLYVDLYYKCMDLDPSLSFTIPEPLKFPDIDTHLIRFWSNNEPLKKKLEDVIKVCFGRISWPEPTSDVCLTIHCDVDTNDRHGRSKIEKWKKECGKRVNKTKELFMVSEKIYVAQEVWIATSNRLVDLNSKHAQDTSLFLRAEEKSLVVIGTKCEAAQLFGEVISIVTKLELQLAFKHQPITKTRYLKVFQLAMVEESKFLEYLKINVIRYKLDESTGKIEIQGKKKEVDDALMKLEQTLQEYVKKRVSGFAKSAKDLLHEGAAQKYIKKTLNQKNVVGIWDVVRGEDLVVYSRSDSDLQRACQIIRDCITERVIQLDSQMESLVKSQTGKDHVLKLSKKYKNQFKIEYGSREIRLACIDAIFDRVYNEIDLFLDLQRVIKETLKVDPGKFRYIKQFKKRQLQDIEIQCNQLSVVIETIVTEEMTGFQLSGKKDDIRFAISKLQTIVDTRVFTKEHKLTTPGIQTFIESEEGLHQCKKIEAKTKCVLLIDRSFLTEMEHRKTQGDGTNSTENMVCPVGKCEVVSIHADITSMQTDAIVNPTTSTMTNSIGLGAAIIEKGGHEIQPECDKLRKARSGLCIGDVVTTKAGKLPCRAIFHAVVPTRAGDSNDKTNLQKVVSACLEEADKLGYESLAIPAIGVGSFQYSVKEATEYMVEAVDMYLKKHGDATSLKRISFCDKLVENVQEFSNAMVNYFGEDIYVYQEIPHGGSTEDELFDGMPRRDLSQEACPVNVEVVVGSLGTQTVEVIVNSTNKNMDMSTGAVSKQLLQAGGDALLKDCREKCPPLGLEVCDIIATSGGAMKCSAIFHGILRKWKNAQESEYVLELFVQNCLEKADKEQFKSIAFPALGTGFLGFPAPLSARIMFDCASTFSSVHLRKVLFVVWSGSPETVKAFQDEERKAGQTKTNVTRGSHFEKDIITQPTNRPFIKTIEGLTIEIEYGDITKEKTDLIVNSTLKQLDLKSGAVSKAILKAAGDTVQAECIGTQQKMLNDGFVYTSAGRLFSKGIIHVKAKSNAADWEKVAKMVMEYADKKGFNSISFPALGTGGKGGDPAIVAMVMFKAFKAYSQSLSVSHCVKKVRIVIYQQDMVAIFKDAMDENKRRTMRPFSKWFSPKKKENEEDKCGVVFHIYSDSEHNLNMAQAFLDSLYQEDRLLLETYGKKGLTPAQVQGLKSMCDEQLVTFCFDEKKCVIILQGYGNAVHDVKLEIGTDLLTK